MNDGRLAPALNGSGSLFTGKKKVIQVCNSALFEENRGESSEWREPFT